MKTTMRVLMILMIAFTVVMCTKEDPDPPVDEVKAIGWVANAETLKKSVKADGDTLKLYYDAGIVDSVELGEKILVLNWDGQDRFTGFNAGDTLTVSMDYSKLDTVVFTRDSKGYESTWYIISDSVFINTLYPTDAMIFDPLYRYDKSYDYWGTDSARVNMQVDYYYTETDHPFEGLLNWVITVQVFTAMNYPYFLITDKIVDYVVVTTTQYMTDPPTVTTEQFDWDLTMDGDQVIQVYDGATVFDIIYK
jgi:hypothetical protein